MANPELSLWDLDPNDEVRRCTGCGVLKRGTDFPPKNGVRGRKPFCIGCPARAVGTTPAERRQWYESIGRDMVLQRLYGGFTVADKSAMYETQGGRCAVCTRVFPIDDLHVDHCHITGCVRGLCCGNCNQGMGQFDDDPAILMRAAVYLLEGQRLIEGELDDGEG